MPGIRNDRERPEDDLPCLDAIVPLHNGIASADCLSCKATQVPVAVSHTGHKNQAAKNALNPFRTENHANRLLAPIAQVAKILVSHVQCRWIVQLLRDINDSVWFSSTDGLSTKCRATVCQDHILRLKDERLAREAIQTIS